jgi:hypothetical protein
MNISLGNKLDFAADYQPATATKSVTVSEGRPAPIAG